MKKNNIKYLEELIKQEVEKNSTALKDFRYKERGVDSILDRVIPKDHKTLMKIAKNNRWLINHPPNSYKSGEIIDADNTIAINLHEHLSHMVKSLVSKL